MKKIYQKPDMKCYNMEGAKIMSASSETQSFNLDNGESYSGELDVKSERSGAWGQGW